MIDYLSQLSKTDIPFIEAGLIIHQPTLKEIAYIGEEKFFLGCQLLNFSKDQIKKQDKDLLQDKTDFEILMTLMNNQKSKIDNKDCLQSILMLLFPDYIINFLPVSIMLTKDNERFLIDKDNFEIFKNIINDIFMLSVIFGKSVQKKYNPGGPQARALVQKFKKRQEKLNKMKHINQKHGVEILSRYISILTVGERKDMNSLLNYTVPQLFDEIQRFKLKEEFETYKQLKLAGAKDVEQVKNWMGDLHSKTD